MKNSNVFENLEINDRDFNENSPKEVKNMKLLSKIIMLTAEFIGTAMLVFFGCVGCINQESMSSLTAPLNFGLVVMFLTQIFGYFSYAIFNPSVTIAAIICKIIDFKFGILYAITQLSGAIVGYGLLKALIPQNFIQNHENDFGFCVTHVHDSISPVQAFCIEFFLTSALILMSCSHWDPKNKHLIDSAPLRMGLTVAALGITGGYLTGASMNPARTFGPAFWNREWRNQWIYWIAPLSSGFLSSFFYKILFWNKNPKESIKS